MPSFTVRKTAWDNMNEAARQQIRDKFTRVTLGEPAIYKDDVGQGQLHYVWDDDRLGDPGTLPAQQAFHMYSIPSTWTPVST